MSLPGSIKPDERNALAMAADMLSEHGLDFPMPWDGSLDDRELEMFVGLVKACRTYRIAMNRAND